MPNPMFRAVLAVALLAACTSCQSVDGLGEPRNLPSSAMLPGVNLRIAAVAQPATVAMGQGTVLQFTITNVANVTAVMEFECADFAPLYVAIRAEAQPNRLILKQQGCPPTSTPLTLQPGESKTVDFVVAVNFAEVSNPTSTEPLPPGRYVIEVGASVAKWNGQLTRLTNLQARLDVSPT